MKIFAILLAIALPMSASAEDNTDTIAEAREAYTASLTAKAKKLEADALAVRTQSANFDSVEFGRYHASVHSCVENRGSWTNDTCVNLTEDLIFAYGRVMSIEHAQQLREGSSFPACLGRRCDRLKKN